jgi:two-component system cell cycle response regulator DivK
MSTILIVEDNPSHMKLASLLVRRFGYEVLGAPDAETALRMAREQRPDLILMDIQLPGMDGLTATRLLKQDAATRGIPVIAVTSYLTEFPERETRAAGCAGFIAKPYHHAELLAAVEAALGMGA